MINLILLLIVVLLIVLFTWLDNKYDLNPTKPLNIFRLITVFMFSATFICLILSMFLLNRIGGGILIGD
jgi:hypothetical protein